jgi:hypothetical protein
MYLTLSSFSFWGGVPGFELRVLHLGVLYPLSQPPTLFVLVIYVFVYFFVVSGSELRASCLLGRYSTT